MHDIARTDAAATPETPRSSSLDPARVTPAARSRQEDGSLITEYGLLAIVAATVAAAVIQWAGDGAMTSLFNALMRQARGIVGA